MSFNLNQRKFGYGNNKAESCMWIKNFQGYKWLKKKIFCAKKHTFKALTSTWKSSSYLMILDTIKLQVKTKTNQACISTRKTIHVPIISHQRILNDLHSTSQKLEHFWKLFNLLFYIIIFFYCICSWLIINWTL